MESLTAKRGRTRWIAERLRSEYPEASCRLTYEEPWQLLVKTILSAQCTDDRVNEVGAHLFNKYRRLKDFVTVPIAELENDVRPTGLFRNKARHIQQTCRMIMENFGGQLPNTMEDLLRLPGVGRKTANVLLGQIFGIPSIVVDTHVIRLSNLLGLTRSQNPDVVEQDLMSVVPSSEWLIWSHGMGEHGRRICIARRPQCQECILHSVCPSSRSSETAP